jgi:hypothetical protein
MGGGRDGESCGCGETPVLTQGSHTLSLGEELARRSVTAGERAANMGEFQIDKLLRMRGKALSLI